MSVRVRRKKGEAQDGARADGLEMSYKVEARRAQDGHETGRRMAREVRN